MHSDDTDQDILALFDAEEREEISYVFASDDDVPSELDYELADEIMLMSQKGFSDRDALMAAANDAAHDLAISIDTMKSIMLADLDEDDLPPTDIF